MKSRALERGNANWTKRVVLGGLGTAGASIALAALAASAFANAANPTSTAGTETVNGDGTVTVSIGGTWSWGELAGVQTSPQNDCAGRSGVGWSVDWWGMTNSPTATSISPLTGSLVNPATSSSSGPTATSGALTPTQTWQVQSGASKGLYFHTTHQFNGFEANLCPKTAANPTGNPDITLDANGAPSGHWSATATYPNLASVPTKICANFYDPHGKLNQFSTSASDNYTSDGDNSIKTNDFDPANVQGNCAIPVLQNPNVNVKKTGPATGDLNGNGTYTIVATNTGGADSPAQTFTDTLPAGESYVSSTGPGTCSAAGQVVTCQLGALAKNGGSATYTVTVKYTQTGDLTDCATINGQANPSCVTTSLPNVSVAKSGPATGDLNGNGTYQIVATNNGTADSKATTFTDTLPAGESYVSSTGPGTCSAAGQVVTCQLGVLAKGGGSATYTVTVTYTQTGDLQDCATINGQAVPSCVTTHVDQPSLLVKKTGPATGLLNGNGTYTIVATNSGGADSKATTFTDTLPAGETYVSSTGPGTCSAAGQIVTCQLGVLAKNGGSASYTVTVTYTQTGDLQDCATINGQANPSCVTTHIPKENVTVAKSGPAVGLLNDNGSYTIVATNNGDGPSKAQTFTDTLPDGESFVSSSGPGTCSAAGQVVTCQLPALAANGGSASYTVVVHYTKTGDLTDCATINGQPVPSCVTTHIVQPNLQVVKTGPATGTLNGNGTYQMVVTNNGNGPSQATTFTDTLPAGESFVANGSSSSCSANGQVVTCTVPALAANGGSASYTVVVTYTKTGDLTDCATIGGQPVPSCVTTHIPGQPSITVVKTNDANGDGFFHDTEQANAQGDSVTFKVVITNTSTEALVIDSVNDAWPGVSALAECPQLIGITLQSGDSVTCTFTVDNYAPAAGDSLTNTITVGGHQPGTGTPVTGTDTSTVTTKSPSPIDLAIVKNADKASVKSGDTLTYTLAVTNVGQGATTGAITVTDSVPSGLDLVSVDGGTAWDCTIANGTDITCTYLDGVLNPGDAAPLITVVTTVNDTAVGTVVNTGVVSTPGDVNPANDRSTVKTPVTAVLPEKIVKPTTPTTPTVLPFTGDRTGAMLPVGLMAILAGVFLTVAGRRRRRTTTA